MQDLVDRVLIVKEFYKDEKHKVPPSIIDNQIAEIIATQFDGDRSKYLAYLRSRGIGEEAARSLLTYAFASDIVERIKVDAVRRDLEEYLFTALPKGEVVRQAV